MEPSDKQLQQIDAEVPSWDDPLEALYAEAQLHAPARKHRAKGVDPREAAVVAEKRLREIYSNPDNWERTRGVALIDEESGVLLGNFSEYRHKSVPGTWDWKREHQPIAISGSKLVKGYLGAAVAEARGETWEQEQEVEVSVVQLDELMVEAPYVRLTVRTRFGGIIQARLFEATQFATPSGNELLLLPTGTDIWRATSVDTKVAIRKAVLG